MGHLPTGIAFLVAAVRACYSIQLGVDFSPTCLPIYFIATSPPLPRIGGRIGQCLGHEVTVNSLAFVHEGEGIDTAYNMIIAAR